MTVYNVFASDSDVLTRVSQIAGPDMAGDAPTVVVDSGEDAVFVSISFFRDYAFFGLTEASSTGNQEVLLRKRVDTGFSNRTFGPMLAGSGTFDVNDSTGYVASIVDASSDIELADVQSGSNSDVVGNISALTDPTQYHWIRYRKEKGSGDTTVFHLAWSGTLQDEPLDGNGDPNWDFTNTFLSEHDGVPGVFYNNDGDYYWTEIAIADAGERASFSAAAIAGISATVLENADGTLDTSRSVTRTITRVSDSTQLFTGSQTSDGTTAELASIDLSATSAATGEAVDDRIVQDTPSNPSAAAVTIRRNVEDIS